ncbi:hypothetical protein NFI96_004156, partial [Prochilodus magdalenae]
SVDKERTSKSGEPTGIQEAERQPTERTEAGVKEESYVEALKETFVESKQRKRRTELVARHLQLLDTMEQQHHKYRDEAEPPFSGTPSTSEAPELLPPGSQRTPEFVQLVDYSQSSGDTEVLRNCSSTAVSDPLTAAQHTLTSPPRIHIELGQQGKDRRLEGWIWQLLKQRCVTAAICPITSGVGAASLHKDTLARMPSFSMVMSLTRMSPESDVECTAKDGQKENSLGSVKGVLTEGNGQVERFNRTLLSMLRTLEDKEKDDWKESLAKVVHAYNCTKSEATGYAPYYLIFGRSPRLPIDLLFKLREDEAHMDYDDYVSCWKQRMQEAYTVASETATKEAARGKAYYDRRVKGRDLQPGDRVLLRNLTPRGGPAKIQSYWENQIYKVMGRKTDDSPVYRICPETGNGREKVVHRNLLLPCDFLPLEKPPAQTVQPQKDSPTVTRKKLRRLGTQQQQPGNGDTSDDDYAGTYQWHLRPVPERQQSQVSLNPLAEPFQPKPSLHVQEEDLPLQSEEDLPLQSEEDLPLQTEEDLPLQTEEDLPLQSEEDLPLQSEEDLPLQSEEDLPLQSEEDLPLQSEEDLPLQSEEDLPLQSEEDLPLQSEEDLPLQSKENRPNQSQSPGIDLERSRGSKVVMDIPVPNSGESNSERQQPKRQSQTPRVLSYDTLGQPTLVQRDK